MTERSKRLLADIYLVRHARHNRDNQLGLSVREKDAGKRG